MIGAVTMVRSAHRRLLLPGRGRSRNRREHDVPADWDDDARPAQATGGFVRDSPCKAGESDPVRLLVYLSSVVTIISLFLDNVTTVLVFAPLTVVIARLLGISPVP